MRFPFPNISPTSLRIALPIASPYSASNRLRPGAAAHPAGGGVAAEPHVLHHAVFTIMSVSSLTYCSRPSTSPETGGGPERLRILLEGESLLNDASSITLFTIFIEFVIAAAEGHPNTSGAGHIIGTIIKKMVWLAVGASDSAYPADANLSFQNP